MLDLLIADAMGVGPKSEKVQNSYRTKNGWRVELK